MMDAVEQLGGEVPLDQTCQALGVSRLVPPFTDNVGKRKRLAPSTWQENRHVV